MRAERDGSVSAAGVPLVVRFQANRSAALIYRVNILGPADSTCQLYVGTIAPTQYRDGTSRGSGDVAEYPNGLLWPGGMDLLLVWDKPGNASAHIEYE